MSTVIHSDPTGWWYNFDGHSWVGPFPDYEKAILDIPPSLMIGSEVHLVKVVAWERQIRTIGDPRWMVGTKDIDDAPEAIDTMRARGDATSVETPLRKISKMPSGWKPTSNSPTKK